MTEIEKLQLRCRELEALNCRYHNAYLKLREENILLKSQIQELQKKLKTAPRKKD